MARDFYIAPMSAKTNGTGTSRSNPIVGLSAVNSNAIGAVSGDRIILLPGTHYEQFIIPASGLTIVSEDTLWDGTNSLNGLNRLTTAPVNYAFEVNGSAWQQVSSSPNIWKKGSAVCNFLFLDGVWLEPMPTSAIGNSAATVIANIAELEWSTVYVALDGADKSLYIRLPIGTTPANYDIRCSGGRIFGTATANGYIQASQKDNLSFEGNFNVHGYYNMGSFSPSIWLDRCTNTTNKNGQFTFDYCLWGTRITAGDNVSIRASGDHLLNAVVSIDAANEVSIEKYVAGTIEVFDWYANYCGWMPRYNGVDIQYGDADGGVAVGYRGGTFTKVIIRDGVSLNGGPSVSTLKTGWAGTLTHGSGVIVETADTGEVKKLEIYGNRIDSSHARGIGVGASGLIFTDNIKICGNLIRNMRGANIAVNWQVSPISVRPTKAGSTTINIDVCNNTISGGTHTISAMGLGNSAALSSNFNIINNLFQGNTLQAGYSTNYGMIRIIDNITGTKVINGNITDVAVGGVYGRVGTGSAITGFTNWQAGGWDLQGSNGTVTIDSLGNATAGTANPIGTGLNYWNLNPAPSSINKEPLPYTGIDIGAWQSIVATHPANLKTRSNTVNNKYIYTLLEELTAKYNTLEAYLKTVDNIVVGNVELSNFMLPSIFSGDKEATATAASELMADNLLKIVVKNLSLTTDAYIGIGTSQLVAETNVVSGTPWVTRFFIPRNTDAVIFMGTSSAYAWKTTSGSAILNITQCR